MAAWSNSPVQQQLIPPIHGQGPRHGQGYNGLGLMALSQAKIDEAEKELLRSATEPKPCAHTTTQGMPFELAEALINKGNTEAPREYLKIVLQKFTPHDQYIKDLLDRINRQKASPKKQEISDR